MIYRATLALFVAGCFSPDINEGLVCGPSSTCPPGQRCDLASGTCVREVPPGQDGAVSSDGSVDDDGAVVGDGAMADADVRSGVEAYYSMQSISGSALADDSGSGHDGTCTACPTEVAGINGGALSFSGAEIITVATSLQTPGPFTVALWANPSGASGTVATMISKPCDTLEGGRNSWTIARRPNSGNDVEYQSFNGTAQFLRSADDTAVPAVWKHWAITWDGTTRKLCVTDAGTTTCVSDTPTNLMFNSDPVTIGADINNAAPALFFTGAIDEIYVFSRAFDEQEINALAALSGA